jgi:hypothetical protein
MKLAYGAQGRARLLAFQNNPFYSITWKSHQIGMIFAFSSRQFGKPHSIRELSHATIATQR